jgi:hypothetical protein
MSGPDLTDSGGYTGGRCGVFRESATAKRKRILVGVVFLIVALLVLGVLVWRAALGGAAGGLFLTFLISAPLIWLPSSAAANRLFSDPILEIYDRGIRVDGYFLGGYNYRLNWDEIEKVEVVNWGTTLLVSSSHSSKHRHIRGYEHWDEILKLIDLYAE